MQCYPADFRKRSVVRELEQLEGLLRYENPRITELFLTSSASRSGNPANYKEIVVGLSRARWVLEDAGPTLFDVIKIGENLLANGAVSLRARAANVMSASMFDQSCICAGLRKSSLLSL